MRWRDVGVGEYGSLGKTLLIGIMAGADIEMLETFCKCIRLISSTEGGYTEFALCLSKVRSGG
jgi:hypothetical protein